jgi:tRNA modification GTPase
MFYALDDTIAAIASPPGGAARGIVRLSGPRVRQCLARYFHAEPECPWAAISGPVVIQGGFDWEGGTRRLPVEVFLWPGARSYTGEPVAEIHTLGSPPLLDAVLTQLCRGGARLAEPGEFTLRAFLAGRIDLTQAEAVLGVIDASDGEQLDAALAQLAGGLARPLTGLRGDLLELLSELEAGLDFPDEDLPFIDAPELDRRLSEASRTVARLVRQIECREEATAAADVVLVGSPNAGKSSLFNAVAGRPGALVSELPGTTRDYLVAEIDLEGVKCRWIDTAGIDGRLPVEHAEVHAAAQSMSEQQVRGAQLRVLCIDASRPLNDWERRQLGDNRPDQLIVLTKIDMRREGDVPRHVDLLRYDVATSSATGEGIDGLRHCVREALVGKTAASRGSVAGTAIRCRESLRRAAEGLADARDAVAAGLGEELIAVELRTALDELGRVVGAVYSDDVLKMIFSRFCIGK